MIVTSRRTRAEIVRGLSFEVERDRMFTGSTELSIYKVALRHGADPTRVRALVLGVR